MSVIVAIKENGVVYMGADTQSTAGRTKVNHLCESDIKIIRYENGMLVGFCGSVPSKQFILSQNDVFVLNSEGKIDKKHIVTEIIPRLMDMMPNIKREKDDDEMGVSILLAHKDKLYKITPKFCVVSLNTYGHSGAGECYAYWELYGRDDLPVREKLLKALTVSAKWEETVGGPYILIDTKNLEYEIVDMGGENH